jgi:hypothetical protein
MTYVQGNPKTKKALKDAIAAGKMMFAYEPGLGALPKDGGRVFLEGPHYPAPHTWYAEAIVDDMGRIIKVK